MEILEVVEMRPRYHLCTNASWLKIRTADGKAGWVYSSLVKGE